MLSETKLARIARTSLCCPQADVLLLVATVRALQADGGYAAWVVEHQARVQAEAERDQADVTMVLWLHRALDAEAELAALDRWQHRPEHSALVHG